MDRRMFLQGTVLGTAAAVAASAETALVRLASAADARLLYAGQAVGLLTSPVIESPMGALSAPVYTQSADGTFHPIGWIESVTMNRTLHEVQTLDGQRGAYPGLVDIDIRVRGDVGFMTSAYGARHFGPRR